MKCAGIFALILSGTLFFCKGNTLTSNVILVDFTSDLSVHNQTHAILATKELLHQTSRILLETIKRPLPSVTFLVPNWWDTSEWGINRIINASVHEKSSKANISIVSSSAFNVPVATQHRGCGQQGRKIIIPSNFLYENKNVTEKGKWLAKEWIKYRYGVFDENGFPDDPMFPEYYAIPGDTKIKITNCAHVPVNYVNRSDYGGSCNLSINSTTDLPPSNPTCTVEILPESNTQIHSSFLDGNINKFANVNEICDDGFYMHDKFAPNKQNLLCRGKSISEVVKKHPDFENQRSHSSDNFKPEFTIAKKQNLRVVIAVQNTENLNNNEEVIQHAIASLVYLLPNGSQYNFLTFSDKINDKSSFTVNDGTHRYIPKFSFSDNVTSSNVAIKEAVKTAIEEFGSSYEHQMGILVVITSVQPVPFDRIFLEKCDNLCRFIITFNENVKNRWNDFLQGKNCPMNCNIVVYVPGNSFLSLKNITSVINSFMEEKMTNTHLLVKTTELSSSSALSFLTDDKVNYFDIMITSNETDMRVMSYHFTLIQDKDAQQIPLQEFEKERGFKIFRVENKKASNWTLKLKVQNKILLVQVVTKQLNKPIASSPKMNIWFESEDSSEDKYQKPIILYAEILLGSYPIIHGAVNATVTSTNGTEISMELYDNGTGDPDITKDDGIYCRYFVQLTQIGVYKVVITANDNNGSAAIGLNSSVDFCCGSAVRYGNLESTKAFNITASITIEMTKQKPDEGYPPSKIQDLRVWALSEPLTYALMWSSPGNEKDHGIAKSYELKICDTLEDAYSFTNEVLFSRFNKSILTAKQAYGSAQYCEVDLSGFPAIKVESSPRSFYITLCSRNDQNLRSEVSNVVRIAVSNQWPTGKISPRKKLRPCASNSAIHLCTEKIAFVVCSIILAAVMI